MINHLFTDSDIFEAAVRERLTVGTSPIFPKQSLETYLYGWCQSSKFYSHMSVTFGVCNMQTVKLQLLQEKQRDEPNAWKLYMYTDTI